MEYGKHHAASLAALLFSLALAACTGGGSATTELYISQPATQSVIRINAADGKVLKETLVGMLPHNLQLSRDGRRLYVVLVGSQAVAEVDTAAGVVLRTFLTEPVPRVRADHSVIQGHIDRDAFSHTTCYDCHRGGAGGVAPAVVGSRPFGIAFSKDGKTLYVCNGRSGNLAVIDAATGALKSLVPLPPSGAAREPTDIALLDDKLFITLRPPLPSASPGVVRWLDAVSLAVLSETPTGANAGVILADVNRRQIYVSNSETNTISRFDAKGAPLGRVTVGDGPFGLRVLPDRNRMIVANYYANSISLIDLRDSQTQTIPLAVDGKPYVNPTHVALDAGRRTAYVVSSGTVGHLLTFDLESRRFTSATKIGGLPFAVVTVPK